jgi:anaerobic ribonucleoside-triphosphate reductase|tara:strand:- start:32 stop:475 length:444 start_codon:yes stop_codon:yes gene_type:complete
MAKTPVGKILEKYLQKKLNSIFEIEAEIAIGSYEGTLSVVDIEKLRKKLNNKTKDLEDMNTQLESYEKVVDAAEDTIKIQEGLSLVPIATPVGPQPSPATYMLVREKSKEIAEDLTEVIKEQGKNSIKMALDVLSNARDTLNNIGKK